jgi:UDP-glucose 4-epimerase
MGKKVLVIGGAGFLGSHVAEKLSGVGYEVTIYDRVSSPWLRTDQSEVIGDITDAESLYKAIAGKDFIYNFAAIADLDEALHKPVETANINVLGNALVLDACMKSKIKRYIYASTVYVNSRQGGFYRCSKQAAEEYVLQYHESYGLNYTILRYGSLYGPRSDKHNGLWRIVHKAVETGIISYQGSPEAMREYIHVEDAALSSVKALGDDFVNQSVILTGQEPMKVVDLLKMLGEIMGLSSQVEFIDNGQVGHYIRTPYAYQPKIGRKYVPQMHVDLGQGLLQLIHEIKAQPKNK